MHHQDEALGAKLLLWSVHGLLKDHADKSICLQAADAELEIKMSFHAGTYATCVYSPLILCLCRT